MKSGTSVMCHGNRASTNVVGQPVRLLLAVVITPCAPAAFDGFRDRVPMAGCRNISRNLGVFIEMVNRVA